MSLFKVNVADRQHYYVKYILILDSRPSSNNLLLDVSIHPASVKFIVKMNYIYVSGIQTLIFQLKQFVNKLCNPVRGGAGI